MAIWSLFLPETGQQLVTADAMPGSALTHARLGGVQRAAAGGGAVDAMGPRFPRSWRLRFEALSQDDRGLLEAAWQDGGAVWLMDPTQRNLLHPNAASTGAAHRNLDGITTSGGTLSRQAPTVIVPPVLYAHTLAVASPGGGANLDIGTLFGSFDPYGTLAAVVESGEQYTYSIYAKLAAASPAVSVNIKFTTYTMTWLNGADSFGSNVALSTSWQRLTRTFTMPAGTGRSWQGLSIPATTNTIHASAAQLEKGASATAWVPGQGPALCVISEYEEAYSYPRAELTDADLTLVEIGGPL